jgi:hypothetical protein
MAIQVQSAGEVQSAWEGFAMHGAISRVPTLLIRSAVLGLAISGLLAGTLSAERPNIVVIMADDN